MSVAYYITTIRPEVDIEDVERKFAPEVTREPSSTLSVVSVFLRHFRPKTPNDTLNDMKSCMNTHTPGLEIERALVMIVRVSPPLYSRLKRDEPGRRRGRLR